MSNIAIKAEGLGKLYRLGEVGTGTISHDLNRWWAKLRGKEDPFQVIGESNDRTSKGKSDYVWALKDVDFEVKQGEVLGIIGRNGAGKSTLLKLLSKVTMPTSGRVKIQGRIASLLEVGTGFHPEMTGRENIFQNGAILGMSRAEIKSKFDEIVDFAGVERYIDTPVKRYSSGMYVRLAFAVAAFLEPEILIIDEVLAVGDAEFQKKCLGRMKDVSVNDGRTVLFVSHNIPAVKQLCNRGLYLKNGTKKSFGEIDDILADYKSDYESMGDLDMGAVSNANIQVGEVKVANPGGNSQLTIEDQIVISISFECKLENKTLGLSFNVYNDEDIHMFEAFVPFAPNNDSTSKKYHVSILIPAFILNSGTYQMSLIVAENQKYVILSTDKVFSFKIEETFANAGSTLLRLPGLVRPKLDYHVR